MNQIQLHDKKFTRKYDEYFLDEKIKELAGRITEDYQNKLPLFLVVLNGAFVFSAILIRNVKVPCEVSFIKLASYHGTTSTGKVHSLMGLTESLAGRNIIIVEDIVDTGNTLQHILEEVKKHGAESVEVATLLLKPEAYTKPYPVKYAGLEVPNEFLVGFGLDYDGLGRNLSSIYTLSA